MDDLKYKVCNKRLYEVVSCLVIEENNTIQIAKNRGGNCLYDEIKDMDFVRVNKEDIKACENITETYHGKNVWYIV